MQESDRYLIATHVSDQLRHQGTHPEYRASGSVDAEAHDRCAYPGADAEAHDRCAYPGADCGPHRCADSAPDQRAHFRAVGLADRRADRRANSAPDQRAHRIPHS